MCTRGIFQLKKLNLWFCESSGSSLGVRNFLQSEQLKKFMDQNQQIEFNVIKRNSRHPFLLGYYLNGYQKAVSLRNELEENKILQRLEALRNSDGSKALQHAGRKVISFKQSIQGKWHENMWDNYPQHELETWKVIEYPDFPSKTVPIIRPSEYERRLPDPVAKLMKKKNYFIEKQSDL